MFDDIYGSSLSPHHSQVILLDGPNKILTEGSVGNIAKTEGISHQVLYTLPTPLSLFIIVHPMIV